MRCAACGYALTTEGGFCPRCASARTGRWWAEEHPAQTPAFRRGWYRRWMDGLAAVAVTVLMLITPSGSFLSPRGRNRMLSALVTVGIALEARYVLRDAFEDHDVLRDG